jgi:spore maturation protein CgeB
MKIVILGLSITSSWGNGHATTYRGLVRELSARGHEVLFLERDVPWYADNRDARRFGSVEVGLYRSLGELSRRYREQIRTADAVLVGSFVPEGAAAGEWVLDTTDGITAFYDIDTPVTLARLRRCGTADYLTRALVPRYNLYLSFTGGPTLRRIEAEFGSPCARALYCSVDQEKYFPELHRRRWLLGYLGTYSADRQPTLEQLLITPARALAKERFVVAGPQYPSGIVWPKNVQRVDHLAPRDHRRFYNRQKFTLNVTRADMIAAGWSPSVRLFEAAACGTAIISDAWPGLEKFFIPGKEILIAKSAADVVAYLHWPDDAAGAVAAAARAAVLRYHTAAHRAVELEHHIRAVRRDLQNREHMAEPFTAKLISA